MVGSTHTAWKEESKGAPPSSELTAAFDMLLDIPGLWGGMMISTLHKMMAMKCDEVSQPLEGCCSRLTLEC